MEHTEYDETVIHQLYRQLISSGVGFGSQRWLANLQRQCECLAILMSSTIPTEDPAGLIFFSLLDPCTVCLLSRSYICDIKQEYLRAVEEVC